MSYFLWSGPPDEELNRVATSEKISERAILFAQVDRMLADEKSSRFVRKNDRRKTHLRVSRLDRLSRS